MGAVMKAIWTVLFVAIAAAILGIAILLVPEASRTDKFWLSMGGIGFGMVAMFVAFAFQPGPQGEQGGSLVRGTLTFVSLLYFVGTIVLALIAATNISFKWLAVLHILALLLWVVITCFAALGAAALANADRRG
jgi:hypothetical protein